MLTIKYKKRKYWVYKNKKRLKGFWKLEEARDYCFWYDVKEDDLEFIFSEIEDIHIIF